MLETLNHPIIVAVAIGVAAIGAYFGIWYVELIGALVLVPYPLRLAFSWGARGRKRLTAALVVLLSVAAPTFVVIASYYRSWPFMVLAMSLALAWQAVASKLRGHPRVS